MKAATLRFLASVVLAAAAQAQTQTPNAAKPFSPFDPINEALPRWVSFGGEYRTRIEGFTGGGYRPGNDDAYVLNRVRLNMRLQPASWMRFQFQGQDARVFGMNAQPAGPPFKDTMDLRMAYMELGDSEKKSLGLRIGRQELVFGDQRLVGHVSWLNTARSFDAVRATARHKAYRLDAFAASVVHVRNGEFNRRTPGNNFHGLYGGIESLVPKAVIEPFAFWRVGPGFRTEGGAPARLNAKTAGIRWVGKLPANFDYGTEMALQRGSVASDIVSAWAGHWQIGYTTPRLKYRPRFIVEYNFASGDRDPQDGRRGTFDQLYPTPHDKYGLADQVGWRNIHHGRLGAELKVTPKLVLVPNYHSFWLASRFDGLYNSPGVMVARLADGSGGRHVGQEADIQAFYALSRQVQLAGGYAYLFPGTFLKRATKGSGYSFPYISLNYIF